MASEIGQQDYQENPATNFLAGTCKCSDRENSRFEDSFTISINTHGVVNAEIFDKPFHVKYFQ